MLRTMLGSADMEMNTTQYLVSRRSQSSDMHRKSDTLTPCQGRVLPSISAGATSPELRVGSALVSAEAGST